MNLSDDLESVIAKSQTFLFLCSQSSNNSDWCRGEVQIAFEKCIQRIIVISLDGSRPQDLRLRPRLYLEGKNRVERETAIQRIINEES